MFSLDSRSFLSTTLEIDAQAEVVRAVAEPLVERHQVLETVEDHLVAAELARLLGRETDQGGAGAAEAEVAVDGDVLDVGGVSGFSIGFSTF
jgi:hypothetical protein